MADAVSGKFQFAIDRGGTFTDIWARCPDGHTEVMKLLSEDPTNYEDAPREGIRRIIEKNTNLKFAKELPLDTSLIEWIRMGTTIATNALLERKGERIALVITKGFRDLLHIGNQARPKIFDLEILCPEVLYEEVVEVEERVVLYKEKCEIKKQCESTTGITGEKVEIWQKVNREKLVHDLTAVLKRGITSLAIVLMHSYTFTGHEQEIEHLASDLGFKHVSLSHRAMPMLAGTTEIVPAIPLDTACADAYLTPCIKRYIQGFSAGFRDIESTQVLFMQSDGGLTPVQKFSGSRAILSGPAGGVVGYAMTTFHKETQMPVIGFDMGGTSTDVSRYAGHYEHVFESTTAGVTIQAPQLDINTVAAGGGSQLFFQAGLFVVGPESAGAHPGPVCYKKGGPLAVTDANLVLGRLLPAYFPHIFGENENEPLDVAASRQAMLKLTHEVNEFMGSQPEGSKKAPMALEDVAMGFIRVANEAMCRPIRSLTQGKGYDTSRHVLACFGGAGGQHACAIARSLGMKTVFIHKYAGILSAYGMALADVVHEAQEPCAAIYEPGSFTLIDERIEVLKSQCVQELQAQGFDRSQIALEPFLHLRYKGTDCALMCSADGYQATGATCQHGDFMKSFLEKYEREFGFTIPVRDVQVDDIRVRGVGRTHIDQGHAISQATAPPRVETIMDVYFEDGFHKTNVYLLEQLQAGHSMAGPAIIIDKNSTVLIEPSCVATITDRGDIQIQIGTGILQEVDTELDTIQLSIFSHRFMSIAEQMGRVLQRTSISTNIKERLDFSCALFGPDGGLVANAPHIPVHLGAMQETVQYQMRALGDSLQEGDVILSNHPSAGGSHLPDLTVITPVFYQDIARPVFFVASRGHHADIGGSTPGSMPPHAKSIFEEGAVFKSFFLVKRGIFQEEAVIAALNDPGKYPGCSGTRNLLDNLSDLRAQVAANQKGIILVQSLIDEYSLKVVQAYMAYIQSNAEVAVKEMLKEIAARTKEKTGCTQLHAVDFMDDGSKIELSIDIHHKDGTATFDFTGTGPEVLGSCNAPRAVTLSAIIYCLRCLVGHDVPLNQGCLKPVKVFVPKGCLLNPSDTAAVVGGNVLTSQRVTDVVLKAFSVCAASQGCMNNFTFGDSDVGYYETVAGGSGAGPTWDGRSGIHTHMTNTRITDPEILERRYPVIVQCFQLNHQTGGKGMHCGGDGVRRELLFRKPLVLSVLTERRVFAPYGMAGGEPGVVGKNLLLRKDGRVINLGGKTTVDVSSADVFCLLTPGGGGYGPPKSSDRREEPPYKKIRGDAAIDSYGLQGGRLSEYSLLQ